MRQLWVRMAVLVTAAVQQSGQDKAETAMFTVLGLAFLCAGGMVALIMAKDRT